MDANIRRKLSMATRALEFVQQHPDPSASWTSLAKQLEDRITRAETLAQQESEGHTQEHASRTQRTVVRREILAEMRHVARVARLAARDNPDLVGKYPVVDSHTPHHILLTQARVTFDTATAEKDVLLRYGLGDVTLDTLGKDVDTFAGNTEGSHTGRNSHVGARADLKASVQHCVEIVRVLGGLVRLRFATDPEQLAAWASVSNVAGPFTRSAAAPPPAQQTGTT